MDLLVNILNVVILFINAVAAISLIWGALWGVVEFVVYEFKHLIKPEQKTHWQYTSIKDHFAHRIAIALEFLLAADLLSLILVPTNEELIQLGGLVAIRIAINFFLTRELESDEKELARRNKS